MSDRLDTALTAVLDAQAANDEQARLIFNPTADVDCAMERVCALKAYEVPHTVIDELLADLAKIYRSNHAERGHEQAAAGNIDQVLRGARRDLTVKGFARSARVLLRGVEHQGAKGLMARRALMKLCAENPNVLAARSLRHELGTGTHDRLIAELGQVSA